MKTIVLKDRDCVWLEGASGWFVGDKESSIHAAQAAVMEALGEDITYTELLGVSGLAFRMQVSKSGLCPSSPHAFCGYQCVQRGIQALPYNVRTYDIKADDAENVTRTRKAVIASIDRGIPVQYGSEEDGIIIGYQKHGDEWICYHPLHEGGKKTFIESNLPWSITVFTSRKTQRADRLKLARGSLEQAVEMAEMSESGEYYLGYAAWIAYIKALETLQQADDATVVENILGNAWIYECLVQYRRRAVSYLKNIADLFCNEAALHLHKATSMYEQIADEVLTDSENCVVSVAPYEWSLKKGQTWSNKMRANQIKRLKIAYSLEEEAIQEIKFSLRSIS